MTHPVQNRAHVRDSVAGALSVIVGLDTPPDANERPRVAALTMTPETTKEEAETLAQLINERLATAVIIQF